MLALWWVLSDFKHPSNPRLGRSILRSLSNNLPPPKTPPTENFVKGSEHKRRSRFGLSFIWVLTPPEPIFFGLKTYLAPKKIQTWYPQYFWPKMSQDQILFLTQNFFDTIFFGPKFLLDLKTFFDPEFIWPQIFLTKNYFLTNFFWP